MVDNSPTFQFQRWVCELRVLEVPKGRLKLRGSSAVPSGLHSILSLFPKVETLGYYRVSLREKDLAPLSHYLVGQIPVALELCALPAIAFGNWSIAQFLNHVK